MTFYYQKSGREIGPLTEREFHARLKSEDLAPDTPVRAGDGGPWSTLAGLLESGLLAQLAERKAAAHAARLEQIRAIVFSARPLAQLPADMGDGKLRAQAYADFLEREFARERPYGPCTLHPEAPGTERAIFHWRAEYREDNQSSATLTQMALGLIFGPGAVAMMTTLGNDSRPDLVTCRTAHDFSAAAAAGVRRNWARARGFRVVAITLAVVGAMAALFALVNVAEALDSLRPEPRREQSWSAFTYCVVAAAVAGSGAWKLFRCARAARLPLALRSLEKHPFRLVEVTWD